MLFEDFCQKLILLLDILINMRRIIYKRLEFLILFPDFLIYIIKNRKCKKIKNMKSNNTIS